MSRKIDDSQRGITNRGLGQQGIVPIALGPTRRSGARAPAPAPAPAKGQPRAPTSNRTIYVVKDEVFMNIPNDVRKAALEELENAFAFVGTATKKRALRTVALEPAKFPEAVTLSDGVVRIVANELDIQASVNNAIRIQVANVKRELTEQGEKAELPLKRTALKPDLGGLAQNGKQVLSGKKRYALPIMASAVALESAISDALDEIGSKIHLQKVLERRANASPRYWASRRALEETEVMMALENPTNPAKWSNGQRQLLGVALGRTMAHEVRHLYVIPHAATGLGADSPLILSDRYARFSATDRTTIVRALQKLEQQQARSTLVRTFPNHVGNFPF